MKLIITKVKELPDARHPFNIEEGFTTELHPFGKEHPQVGERFPSTTWWSTSVVQEVIDDHTFRTLNSIYEYRYEMEEGGE